MKTNLKEAVTNMLDCAVLCEDIIEAIIDVWDPSDNGEIYYIDYIFDSSKPIHVHDMVQELYIQDARESLTNLEDTHSLFEKSNKKMIHWPDSMKEEKELYEKLYDAYLNLYQLATSPSGNFMTYTSNANDCIAEFSTQFQKIEIYLE